MRHHLFLACQGVEMLLSALVRNDQDAVRALFPLYVLDLHSALEADLKREQVVVRGLFSEEHSLTKLGGELAIHQMVDKAHLWERYVYSSQAWQKARGLPSPKALGLIQLAVEGRSHPKKIADFVVESFIPFLTALQLPEEPRRLCHEIVESAVARASAPTSRSSRRRGKGKKRAVASERVDETAQEIRRVAAHLPTSRDWRGSPAIAAREAMAHWERLKAAGRVLPRYSSPEYAASADRLLQTAHFIFEQSYAARMMARDGGVPASRHGFAAKQKELDQSRAELNAATRRYLVGNRRRYPEQYEEAAGFVTLLGGSRLWVGVSEGFVATGERAQAAARRVKEIKGDIAACERVAREHFPLLLEGLRDHMREERLSDRVLRR